jgi:hypothetical protein
MYRFLSGNVLLVRVDDFLYYQQCLKSVNERLGVMRMDDINFSFIKFYSFKRISGQCFFLLAGGG